MIDHHQLLAVADELATPQGRGAPKQVRLRRAVSSAYYALFHFFLSSAADLLVGRSERDTPRYRIMYRSFEHAEMRNVCEEITKTPMRAAYIKALDREFFGTHIRTCAAAFVELQARRHEADYDPAKRIALLDAKAALTSARAAIAAFNAAPVEEQNLLLTILRFKARA